MQDENDLTKPIMVRNGKKEYAFHSDRLTVTKKNKVIREILYDEISQIQYNYELGRDDILAIFLGVSNGQIKTLIIFLKKGLLKTTYIKMDHDVFEKVKKMIPIDIEIV